MCDSICIYSHSKIREPSHGTYPTWQAGDVLRGAEDFSSRLKDKIVFIGVTDPSSEDLLPTPYSGTQMMAGVEFHAAAAGTITAAAPHHRRRRHHPGSGGLSGGGGGSNTEELRVNPLPVSEAGEPGNSGRIQLQEGDFWKNQNP